MAEQKMTDEQLSQELHKRNGGRAGGTLLSLLCGTMLFSLCSQSVAAAAGTQTGSSITVGTGNLCEHHPEHDDECGCSEGTTGTACSHEHTDDCYTEVLKCVHKHDDECGYSPATRGTPCEFDCEICGVDDDMKTATPSNAKAVTVAGVQAMIDALPDVEDVRKGNAEKVKVQLDAIDDAKAELSDEEIDELDLSRYMEVAAALEQLLYGVATQSNAVMLADYDGPAIQLGTGGISGGIGLEMVAMSLLNTDLSIGISSVLLGLGLGLTMPEFLMIFVKLSHHCQRGTANTTHLLASEVGISLGIATACYMELDTDKMLHTGQMVASIALLFFVLVTYPYYIKKKVR